MSHWIVLLSSTTLLAGCGGLTTPTTPNVVEEVVLPSLDRIDFELYSSDGSKLDGAANVNKTLEVRGECALSDATPKVSVRLMVHIVARARNGPVTIHSTAAAGATGDDPSHLRFATAIPAPAERGTYTVQVMNSFRQEQRAEVPLRIE